MQQMPVISGTASSEVEEPTNTDQSSSVLLNLRITGRSHHNDRQRQRRKINHPIKDCSKSMHDKAITAMGQLIIRSPRSAKIHTAYKDFCGDEGNHKDNLQRYEGPIGVVEWGSEAAGVEYSTEEEEEG
jgi:hypothetical protein